MKKLNILFGIHAVLALLKSRPHVIERLCVKQSRSQNAIEELLRCAKKKGIQVEFCSKEQLDQMSNHETHQGVVAHYAASKASKILTLDALMASLPASPFLLILDQIQDPHNLGACFRVADAAGVDAIIASKDKSTNITPIVSKVASGAVETVPFIQVSNLVSAMKELKKGGIWLYGATEKAKATVYNTTLSGPIGLVMGGEGQGLRRLTQEHCDVLVRIPMYGSVLSLNVAVAAGILLFEIVRQRNI